MAKNAHCILKQRRIQRKVFERHIINLNSIRYANENSI